MAYNKIGKEEKRMLKKIVGHIKTVTKHKWLVFKLCCRAGIPWRGFMHDWSKFSPTEFWESVKYYTGKRSPIPLAKAENGYSKAWLHHKGRNKHHAEYWYDYETPQKTFIMPYVYAVEMICDNLAAGITYNGKNWTKSTQLEYWETKGYKKPIHPKMAAFEKEVYTQVSKDGIHKVIKKENLKKLYQEIVEENREKVT